MADDSTKPGNDQEQRRLRRMHCLKGGHIVFNAGYASYDCVVHNITEDGAMLEMDSLLGIPHAFTLVMNDGHERHHCVRIWHTDRRMGVAFVAEPEGENDTGFPHPKGEKPAK